MNLSFKGLFTVTFTLLCFWSFSQQSFKPFRLVSTISVGDSLKWDYLNIDTINNHLFISHQTRTIVIDISTEKVVGVIDPTPGAHGIAIDNDLNKGFITDGQNATVTVFDLKTLRIITTIPSGSEDPDAILYDRFSKTVFVMCGDGHAVVLIDPNDYKVIKVISLPGGPEFAVSDLKGSVYINIEDLGAVVKIDATKRELVNQWSLDPGQTPTGLAIDRNNGLLFSGCRGNKSIEVIDVKSGKVVSTLPIGSKVDAVRFDPYNKNIYSSNGEGNVSVYHEKGNNAFELLQTIQTKPGCKTMSLDPRTHKLYVPVMSVKDQKGKSVKSFEIFVFAS